MSVGICGKIKLYNYNNIVDISYFIQEIAMKNKIWCKLGGNVSEQVYDIYGNDGKYLYFEITDSPIDNFADELLMPNMDKCKEYRKDKKNKVYINLEKIRHFLIDILEMQIVKKIILDINYLFRENEKYLEIGINEFTKYVYNKYEEEDFFVPTICLTIHK